MSGSCRCLIIAILLLPSTANALWYRFQPCGFTAGIEADSVVEPEYAKAPNLTVILWYIPMTAVVQVVGVRPVRGKTVCSWLSVNNDQWLVVGSPDEIYKMLVDRRVKSFTEY